MQLSKWETIGIEIEIFNDIHEDSGGYLHWTVSSISLQSRLASVNFTGTNGIQSHPPTGNCESRNAGTRNGTRNGNKAREITN